jgi:hypothetical protein
MNVGTAIEQLETMLHNNAAAFAAAAQMGDVTLCINLMNAMNTIHSRLERMIGHANADKVWSDAFSDHFHSGKKGG